ncbi:hypothetical protein WMY93_012385 [Mugilogobius chulae]|uniref:ribonuclease H n=1 Tax=Mugilogobius chulae TaxID=88201 RepID=A0AAW0P8X1_9GOBI
MYIDDWLLAAHSSQQLREHTELLLAHLTSLGFTINWEKSVLVPSQSAKFIGLRLNSVTNKAQLSVERIEAFSTCLATFRRGALLHYRTCHRLQGLMASALVVIPLGCLYMRPFQTWVAAFHLDPARHAHKLVPVTTACVRALSPWRRQGFLSAGVPMGTVIARKVITTDASLRGWGATHEGRTVSGVWSLQMRLCHVNYLELRAVHLALHHFLPLIKGQHVLVRTDNTTLVAYINKQGARTSVACPVTQSDIVGRLSPVIVESHTCPRNHESRSGPALSGHPLLQRLDAAQRGCQPDMGEIWKSRGGPIRVTREHAMSPVFLSDGSERTTGPGRVGTRVATCPPVFVSPIRADHSYSLQGSREETLAPPRSPSLAHHELVGGDIPAFVQPTVGSAVAQRPGVTARQRSVSSSMRSVLCAHCGLCGRLPHFGELFVSWAPPHQGKPLTKQRLSHWIVEAISVAYESSGLHPPAGLRAHSTCGMATSWAMFRGTSVEEICAAASWATPHTFASTNRGPRDTLNAYSVAAFSPLLTDRTSL